MRQFVILSLVINISIFSQELKIGDFFPEMELEDQSESLLKIPGESKKIFFIADMNASKLVHAILEKDSDQSLESQNAILISDIHKMPSLITQFVALPKMKRYPYKIHLIRDDTTGSVFPREKDKITVFTIKKKKIVSIRYLGTKEEFEKVLKEK
jgi:hypothetical protein